MHTFIPASKNRWNGENRPVFNSSIKANDDQPISTAKMALKSGCLDFVLPVIPGLLNRMIYSGGKLMLVMAMILTAMAGCSSVTASKEEDDNTPPVATKLEITETSPEFVFWGDNMTITGTGFSTKAEDNYVWIRDARFRMGRCNTENDSTGWQRAAVLNATSTSLTIRIPFVPATQTDNNEPCGVYDPRISVTVAGKTALSSKVKLLGIPVIDRVCYANSGWQFSGLVPGKELKNMISITGLGIYGNSSGMSDKMRMSIAQYSIDLERVVPSLQTCGDGYTFVVPIELASGECTPDPIRTGTFAKKEIFVASVESKVSPPFSYPIRSFPDRSVSTFSERHFSMMAAGNPEIVLTGKNMQSYTTALFNPVGSSCTATTIAPVPRGDDLVVGIPLSSMAVGCAYSLILRDHCGSSTGQIGLVRITP
ncbi:MAG: hypothetical protein EA364_07490 [Balneolaceae bacterium]|nr:MAG: hypothetical protein EA364_07490 [Balneolaceae bacterium]